MSIKTACEMGKPSVLSQTHCYLVIQRSSSWAIIANPSPVHTGCICAPLHFYCWYGSAGKAQQKYRFIGVGAPLADSKKDLVVKGLQVKKGKPGWDGGRSTESHKVFALLNNKVTAERGINPVSETGFNYQVVDTDNFWAAISQPSHC